MGSNSDRDRVGRQVPRACLIDSHALINLRRRCGAAGSHPEREPPAGSIDPFDRVAAQAVAAVPVLAVGLARPKGLRHPPCRLLLVLRLR